MKKQHILFWIVFLIAVDQAVKIVVNAYFLDTHFEIIPGLLEFKPFFNSKHSYLNSLLYKYFNINLGLWFHILLFLFAQGIFLVLYGFLKSNSTVNKKLLDAGMVFQLSGFACAFIGNIIWKNGILDFIYLKPLFIFDFKDVYLNCFAILFIIFVYTNNKHMKHLKMKDIFQYSKTKLKQWNEETTSCWKSKR